MKKKIYTHTHTHTHMHTNIVTEKTKTIYPLYTSYTGGINIPKILCDGNRDFLVKHLLKLLPFDMCCLGYMRPSS